MQEPTLEQKIRASIAVQEPTLEQKIRASIASPITSDNVLDPERELAEVLSLVGLDVHAGGGTVTFTGKDPIFKSPWPLATMGGVALMAQVRRHCGPVAPPHR